MSGCIAIDVLIPTRNRTCALVVTLATLSAQSMRDFRIVISDQSDGAGPFDSAEYQAVARYLGACGIPLVQTRHLPRRGMAEQRAYLLSLATAPFCLFLDDDVIVEPDLLERMHAALLAQRCGFVGSALHGLSYLNDHRPEQEAIEFWEGTVGPESLTPDAGAWQRHHLHSAANLFHVQQNLDSTRNQTRCYRVAWCGGCVLYDTAKLRECGGFDFWRELPAEHCGEDVQAQLAVMARYGGCGIIPSGAYHMELPTTIVARELNVPVAMSR